MACALAAIRIHHMEQLLFKSGSLSSFSQILAHRTNAKAKLLRKKPEPRQPDKLRQFTPWWVHRQPEKALRRHQTHPRQA